MASLLEIHNLKKYFGKTKAVDDISLNIEQGEIFGFLGPNGAGKTTTIRCLMGFSRPDSGKIHILGYNMQKQAHEAKKHIGYLPGNVKLYKNWTGREHISFFENVRGEKSGAKELIKRLDFDDSKKFKNLSSGNKQKLGLILALMHDPKLIVMDEPTVGLDPLLQNEIYAILQERRAKGSTIFISSHNLPEVEKLCDRVAIIRDGKIVAIDNIRDIGAKKLYKITVSFGDKVLLSEFKLKGIDKIKRLVNGLEIDVVGDLSQVLRVIMRHKVLDLEIAHASLEDIFMKFYEKEFR